VTVSGGIDEDGGRAAGVMAEKDERGGRDGWDGSGGKYFEVVVGRCKGSKVHEVPKYSQSVRILDMLGCVCGV
jgi:hypothetical protein